MRKLTRGHAPACLARLKSEEIEWRDVPKEDQAKIWLELNKMQKKFCAYCECLLSERKHIEHFKKQQMYRHLIFDWPNLFGSCGCHGYSLNSCGFFKDNQAGRYDIAQLIKPDQYDPQDFLFFSEIGKVLPHSNLSDQDQKKASETIRVLNLNDLELINRRKVAIKAILPEVQEFWEISKDFNEEDYTELFHDILDKIEKQEFQTALRHRFDYNKT